MGTIIYNGISSESLGIIVQAPPAYEFPEDEIEMQHIPGRNGDLAIPTGAYQNVTRTYSFASIYSERPGGGGSFINNSQDIIAWLKSHKGQYCRLEDTYDPNVYRMAIYTESKEFVNYFNKVTVIEAEFNCKPQRWLKEGETEVTKASGETITNPTSYTAKPILTVTVHGTAQAPVSTLITFTAGTSTQTITIAAQSSEKAFVIDCEDMFVTYNGANACDQVTLGNNEFPEFAGDTTYTITITGNVTLNIKPRWWTL